MAIKVQINKDEYLAILDSAESDTNGVLVPVLVNNEVKSGIRLYVKEGRGNSISIEVDIDGTGYKVSDIGRELVDKMIQDKNVLSQPKRKKDPDGYTVNSYALEVSVESRSDDRENELETLKNLFSILEEGKALLNVS